MPKYVITGGPSVGKTSVLNELAKKGYRVIQETAREIIDEQLKKGVGILPWKDPITFQEQIAKRQMRMEREIKKEEIVFLDRGLPDGVAYYILHNVKPPKKLMALSKKRYAKVFVLDPLLQYTSTYYRKEDEKTAKKEHKLVIDVYERFGYKIVRVPPLSVQKRVDYILKRI
jgi:predicted ATPase